MSYSYKCYSDTKDFMKKFLNKVVFLHNLPGIQSCVFENLTSTDFICAYSIPNHIDLDNNSILVLFLYLS